MHASGVHYFWVVQHQLSSDLGSVSLRHVSRMCAIDSQIAASAVMKAQQFQLLKLAACELHALLRKL